MSKLLKAGLVAWSCMALATAAQAAEFDSQQKQQIETVVREYLLNNPEILREMSERLQQKDQLAEDAARNEGLKQHAELLFRNGADPVAGNPNGDVTIIEFMDYNCGWCKKSVTEIISLTEADKNVRVVIKEFPIFGAGSDYAARAALAANKQGKYWELHAALFKQESQVTPEIVDSVAESLGIDVAAMKRDMDTDDIKAVILANQELAKSLRIEGTPAFIVDQVVVPGYVPVAALADHIKTVRTSGGCKLC